MKVRFRAKELDDIASIHRFRERDHSAKVAERVEAAIVRNDEDARPASGIRRHN
jgi:hypothetical protein